VCGVSQLKRKWQIGIIGESEFTEEKSADILGGRERIFKKAQLY
jgi:hypothetical protein